MVKHLYIIGNGFDLHHEINSKYSDFRIWLSETNCDLLCRMDEVYGDCDKEWWADFENQLASLDAIQFGEQIAFENSPDLMSEHCDRTWNDAEIEVERQLDSVFYDLRESFHDWILQLNPPSRHRKVIFKYSDAIFINFNYTDTLEKLYGIHPQKILHIHGYIGSEDDEFVLGHGKSYNELQQINSINIPEPPKDLSSEELADYYEDVSYGQELHEQLAIGAAINAIATQQKPIKKIIEKYSNFFESIEGITEIHVYGLSLSEVDKPYLFYFTEKFKDAHWEFSDFEDYNRDKIESFCKDRGITTFSIIDLNNILDTRQLTIPYDFLS